MKAKKMQTIKGIPIPSAWDESGNVIAVAIAAFDEQKYLVAENAMAHKLRHCLQKPVTVEGKILKEDNKITIVVKKFKTDGLNKY